MHHLSLEGSTQARWAQDQKEKAKLLEYLDTELITADLHTHLMGMGDHSFWIDQIMRSYLFSRKDRDLASLEWYGPLCYHTPPSVEIVLKTAEAGSYSVHHGTQKPVDMKYSDGYHGTVCPTSDPFSFTVAETKSQRTQEYTVPNWALSKRVVCYWDEPRLDVDSRAYKRWLAMGFPQQDWKMYTMLNWHDLKRTPLNDQLVATILRAHRDREWLNLPLSPPLCLALMEMEDKHEIPEVNSPWNWQRALNFTTDVVFDIKSFRVSMNIASELGEDNTIHEIVARLALNRNGNSGTYLKRYMFFNVKAQEFDYQLGITNTDLCYLMDSSTATTRSGTEMEAMVTQAQIRNCFTMLNIDGSSPTNSDLVHRFRRHFTPEFYPMRFKLRDPIYEQHPKTLTKLLANVLTAYSASRTSYVEFSLSLNDLTTPWIYQYLVHETIWNAIPGPEWQENARQRKKMEYKFLIGVSREYVKLPINGELKRVKSDEALDFLIRYPNLAMAYSFNPEAYSHYDSLLDQLKSIFSPLPRESKESGLLQSVVGLDLVSEELGFPYCPFVQGKWLKFASKYKLGFRLHCGEGVIREKTGQIADAMYAHMYIMALAIRRICAQGLKCRIGHGVAFNDCIIKDLTDEEKAFERIPPSHTYCIPDGVTSLTPFLPLITDLLVEVNITSNSYLVQHANPTSLIKVLKHWLLCTDDDGVWAPLPCPHQHHLQAREYCRAISMGYIDRDDLEKATSWRDFRFAHSKPHPQETLKLRDTWSCIFHPLRATAVFAMALITEPKYWTPHILLYTGVTEFLHSFGFYNKFTQFKTMVPPFESLMESVPTHEDPRFQYFLKLLKPDDTYYGLLRSLFLAFDECLHTIWYAEAIVRIFKSREEFPLPPLVPGKSKPTYKQNRQVMQIAPDLLAATNAAFRKIIGWIEQIRQLHHVKNDEHLSAWIQSRIDLANQRGRSETEYGNFERDQQPLDKVPQLRNDSLGKKWASKRNFGWEMLTQKSEIIKELDGLILGDARFLTLESDNCNDKAEIENDHPSFFHIIWNTQDWYIRHLPPTYNGQYKHLDTSDVEHYHTTITRDDRVPLVWYNAALSIAKRLFNPAERKLKQEGTARNNPQTIRIAGVGFSGSAIAVLVGMLIATELRNQEVKRKYVSNEVIVWAYGGRQFGSPVFHQRIHNLCSYNLEITRWLSLQDKEAKEDPLFALPYCSDKQILVYPIGAPMITSWKLRPSWHYFALMLHHLPPCMDFRDEIPKPNEMNIFFAHSEKDLASLAQSLYFPQYTLICTHENRSDITSNDHFGPLAVIEKYENVTDKGVPAKEAGLIVKLIPQDDVKIPPYVWKWNPQQHKSWVDVFDLTPVQRTLRFVGDLLLGIMALPPGIIISLSPDHADIVNFVTMAPQDFRHLNEAKKLQMPNELKDFMDLADRRDTFGERYCLLLLDFTYIRRSSVNDVSHIWSIRRQLEKSFSMSIPAFRHPKSDLITNIEILLIALRKNDIHNPFLHYVLNQLENLIELKEKAKVEAGIIQLLLLGALGLKTKWPSRAELDVSNDYSRYKPLFNKAAAGSYKAFDLALSLYFLKSEDKSKTRVIEAALRRIWDATDWMTRRINQKNFIKELWEYHMKRVSKIFTFLDQLEIPEQTEYYYIFQVEHQKYQVLSNCQQDCAWSNMWRNLRETLYRWFKFPGKAQHVLLADAFFHYGQSQQEALSDKERSDLIDVCSELIDTLDKMKSDNLATWTQALLLYLRGLITDKKTSEDFMTAFNHFSTLRKLNIQPKDKFSIALNAACCLARVGRPAQAIAWIGYFFDVLDMASEVDRDVAFGWLEDELNRNEGDLKDDALLKQVIEPWLLATKHRFVAHQA